MNQYQCQRIQLGWWSWLNVVGIPLDEFIYKIYNTKPELRERV
jgi:hypothetical protein